VSNNNGWISKMWYIYIVEYYSAIKKHEIMLLTGKGMKLEIMLTKISQSQNYKCCVFPHIWNLDLKNNKNNIA
jgi:hypothetical protein